MKIVPHDFARRHCGTLIQRRIKKLKETVIELAGKGVQPPNFVFKSTMTARINKDCAEIAEHLLGGELSWIRQHVDLLRECGNNDDIKMVEEEILSLQADMAAPPTETVESSSTTNSRLQTPLGFVKLQMTAYKHAREISPYEIQRLKQGYNVLILLLRRVPHM